MADAAGEGEEEGPEGLSEGHAAAAGDASRVILHLDLDCFYCAPPSLPSRPPLSLPLRLAEQATDAPRLSPGGPPGRRHDTSKPPY